MRKLILSLVLLLVVISANSQNRKKFRHIITQHAVESKYLPLKYINDKKDTIPITICSPKLEGIISMVGQDPTIDFFTITDDVYASNNNCINKGTVLGKFILDLGRKKMGDPTISVRVPFRARSWSVATVPFRYRYKTDSSFSTVTTNLSVSFSFGWTRGYSVITHRGINNYSLTLGPFIGLSSAELKKSAVKQPSSWTTDRTNFAMSYGASATLARNNFGFVVSIGFDHAFGKNSTKWSYQDKPWIGLGINSSLGLF